MNDRRLRRHFARWHHDYDDAGRVGTVGGYRALVHHDDHDDDQGLRANHRHVLGFTIRRR